MSLSVPRISVVNLDQAGLFNRGRFFLLGARAAPVDGITARAERH